MADFIGIQIIPPYLNTCTAFSARFINLDVEATVDFLKYFSYKIVKK